MGPTLDVSSVLLDPMFVTRGLICTRSTQSIGDDGFAVNTPTNITFAGVVTNDRGDVLIREAAGSRVEGNITIHTRFRLTDGKDGRDADVVTYKGRQYMISNVLDWSDYGRGFVCATGELMQITG